MKKLVLGLIVTFSTLGCSANYNSIYRTFDVTTGKSPMVDIRQRAVIVAPRIKDTEIFDQTGKSTGRTVINEGVSVCAEPSPDAMASLAYELAAKGGVPEQASGELAFAMNDSAAFTGLRTQSIQLLRDFGYRLCESRLSGAITQSQYDLLMRRFQKNTVALLAIEQLTGTVKTPPIVLISSGKAEATKALTEQITEREKIADQIANLEKQKTELEKARKEAKDKDSNAATTETDGKIKDLTDKIARFKDDKNVIDKAIADNKGVVAEGRTEVTIKTDALSQRSDEHIQKVAEVVSEIVNNIVLSDDENQICMSALQSEPATQQQKDFSAWCLKKLNNQVDADVIYVKELQNSIQTEKQKAKEAQPAEKPGIEKRVEELKKELKEKTKGNRYFSK